MILLSVVALLGAVAPPRLSDADPCNGQLRLAGATATAVAAASGCTSAARGCMVPTADNYAPDALVHDRSCVFSRAGCTDSAKLGYQPAATRDDGSCGPRIARGCVLRSAVNFNSSANVDDGSCRTGSQPLPDAVEPVTTGSRVVVGCTAPAALNYDPLATVESGLCEFGSAGCLDSLAANYDLPAARGPCAPRVAGCMVRAARNYNPSATVHERGACEYQQPEPEPERVAAGRGGGGVARRPSQQPPIVLGCPLTAALNYQPNATRHDGSCVFPRLGCTDPRGVPLRPCSATPCLPSLPPLPASLPSIPSLTRQRSTTTLARRPTRLPDRASTGRRDAAVWCRRPSTTTPPPKPSYRGRALTPMGTCPRMAARPPRVGGARARRRGGRGAWTRRRSIMCPRRRFMGAAAVTRDVAAWTVELPTSMN